MSRRNSGRPIKQPGTAARPRRVLTGEQTPDKLDDFTPVAWSASAFSRSSHKSARGSAEHLHHMGRKKADPERQLTVHHQPQRQQGVEQDRC
jgi:hypothetical protein